MSRGPLAESCARLELPSYFTFLANEYEMFWWIFDERTVTVESLTVFIAAVDVVGCNRKFLERIKFRDFFFFVFNWIFLDETAEPIIISRVSLAFKNHLKPFHGIEHLTGCCLPKGAPRHEPFWSARLSASNVDSNRTKQTKCHINFRLQPIHENYIHCKTRDILIYGHATCYDYLPLVRFSIVNFFG